ncbi:MAG: hypothetical protein DRQ06_00730 [Candidatus Hydrothermota bacterium]|uniref:Type 4 fimbrial biogenesis protein PilX N-terminal domain-containing protein n=1 Tax=candidate division WOR-3 bacterium TaxID=2052148 RepID=A0A7C0X8Y4_UNCW3|nr:MAG: hypothetical protein DRQ06_00730 [Candidatus Hydrothermae bacterium]HDM89956.1 hypothetical protein [candidate division WOR-3 bacterium]
MTAKNDRGIALITVLILLAAAMLVGIYAIYMTTKGLEITGGVRRYSNALEAAQAGVDLGVAEIEKSFVEGGDPSDQETDLGSYHVKVEIKRLFAAHVTGGAVEFAAGYEGLGKGSAGGGTAVYYRIISTARGPRSSRVQIEALYRKSINIHGG